MAKPAKKKAVHSTASKTSAASPSFNKEIALLLQLASAAPVLTFPEMKSAAKLYELAVLAELFLEYRDATKGTVKLIQPKAGKPNTFAGAPASANKDKFAWFQLWDAAGQLEAEGWVSVQFVGLSARRAIQNGGPGVTVNFKASSHELDLSLLAPEPTGGPPRQYPLYEEVMAAVSVKHVSSLQKESIREALGFRREMGLLMRVPLGSNCDWLQADVPCDPPSPLFLASSAENFEGYDGHIDQLGLYPRFMKFPY